MKKILIALCLCFSLCVSAFAESGFVDLQPGTYEIGKDVPAGKYDIRFNGLNQFVTVAYSAALDESGNPDLTKEQSFSFTFGSASNWWNIGGFTVTLYPGFLRVEDSACRLWTEE